MQSYCLLLLPANQAYLELWVGIRWMFAMLILLSQKQEPSRNESYTLIKMCECVDVFSGWLMKFLVMNHLSPFLFLSRYELSFLLFLTCPKSMWYTFFGYASFILTCLVSMWHTFFGYASFSYHAFSSMFLISICIAHICDDGFWRETCHDMHFILWVYGWHVLHDFQCGNRCVFVECTWYWSWVYGKVLTRVKEFDKTQIKFK